MIEHDSSDFEIPKSIDECEAKLLELNESKAVIKKSMDASKNKTYFTGAPPDIRWFIHKNLDINYLNSYANALQKYIADAKEVIKLDKLADSRDEHHGR